eukprot:1190430-Prorocentrum_minimum.AAC.4
MGLLDSSVGESLRGGVLSVHGPIGLLRWGRTAELGVADLALHDALLRLRQGSPLRTCRGRGSRAVCWCSRQGVLERGAGGRAGGRAGGGCWSGVLEGGAQAVTGGTEEG